MDQELRRKLNIIGIPEAKEIIEMIEHDPSYASMSFDEKLRIVVDHVAQEKENAHVNRLIRQAHLRSSDAGLSAVIYDGRDLNRETVNNLGTCKFVDNATDIALLGYTGTGKTYLASAIGKQACRHGLSTLYIRMPDLLMERSESLAAGVSESKLLKKYARYKVLIIDEWLIDPLKADPIRFFLELVDRRYDRSSTVWCSQYPIEDWHKRLGGGAHADAILDRIVHNAVVLKTGEKNMRKMTKNKR